MYWCRSTFFFSNFRDAMQQPLELDKSDQLPAVDLADWLDFNFPSRELSPVGNLASHIAKGLGLEEQALCWEVHAVFCDPENREICQAWLYKRCLVAADYGMDLVLAGAPTDELFLQLTARAIEVSVLVVHMGGLWTLKVGSKANIGDDIFLVYTTEGFMQLLPMMVSDSAVVFQAPDSSWTSDILVLEGLVHDVAGMLGCTGFVPLSTLNRD